MGGNVFTPVCLSTGRILCHFLFGPMSFPGEGVCCHFLSGPMSFHGGYLQRGQGGVYLQGAFWDIWPSATDTSGIFARWSVAEGHLSQKQKATYVRRPVAEGHPPGRYYHRQYASNWNAFLF